MCFPLGLCKICSTFFPQGLLGDCGNCFVYRLVVWHLEKNSTSKSKRINRVKNIRKTKEIHRKTQIYRNNFNPTLHSMVIIVHFSSIFHPKTWNFNPKCYEMGMRGLSQDSPSQELKGTAQFCRKGDGFLLDLVLLEILGNGIRMIKQEQYLLTNDKEDLSEKESKDQQNKAGFFCRPLAGEDIFLGFPQKALRFCNLHAFN